MAMTLQPMIHKARVQGLTLHVARSGIAPGDTLDALAMPDGRIGLVARVRAPILGLIPRRQARLIGHLGPRASDLVRPELDRADALRLRVVGVTPEFLAGPEGPEIHVSVWVRA